MWSFQKHICRNSRLCLCSEGRHLYSTVSKLWCAYGNHLGSSLKMQMCRIHPLSLIIYVRWGKESAGHKSTRRLQDLSPTQQHDSSWRSDSGPQRVLPHEGAAWSGPHASVRAFSLTFPLTLMVMCPCTFSISPSMADIKEDFPEPTVPTTATSWPGIMSRFTLKESSVLEGEEGTYSRGIRATSQTLWEVWCVEIISQDWKICLGYTRLQSASLMICS